MKTQTYSIPEIFDKDGFYIQPEKYFFHLFGKVPSVSDYVGIYFDDNLPQTLTAKYDAGEEYACHIKSVERYEDEEFWNSASYLFVLKSELILYFRAGFITLYHTGNKMEIDLLMEVMKPNQFTGKQKSTSFLLIESEVGLYPELFTPSLHIVLLKMHYNDDLLPVHSQIISFMEQENTGLILLSGEKGTGKTNYINHLISHTYKKAIYVNNTIFEQLDYPKFTALIAEHPDTVFIFEDCEAMLMNRTNSQQLHPALSTLLQMSKDYYSEVLSIKFIVSFNAPLWEMDAQLLTADNLMVQYEFGALAAEKANELIKVQNLKIPIQSAPILLSKLYVKGETY